MDAGEKILLKNLSDDIKEMNKNIIYLCGRNASAGARLKNIEDIVRNNDDRLSKCESKITTMKTWGVAIGSIIMLSVPIVATIV